MCVSTVGVVGAALAAALDPVAAPWSSVGTCLLTSVSAAVAALRTTGRMRLAWALLALPFLLYAAGDALWVLHARATGAPPILSVADALYVVALLPLTVALVVYPVIKGGAGRWRLVVLDAAVVVLAVSSLTHTLALSEVLLTAADRTEGLMLAVYPWTDGLLASLALVALLRSTGRPRPDVVLLGLSFAAYTAADTGWALLTVRGLDGSALWIDVLYRLAPLPVAGAAWLVALTRQGRRPLNRHASGLVAPLLPDLAALLAVGLALALSPEDPVSRGLALLLVITVFMRQVAQTASTQDLGAQLEERVAERNRELEDLAEHHRRLDQQQAQFVSSVSHELRTPLTAIRGSLELLRDGDAGPLSPEATAVVAVAARGTERLGRLVDDIIDLERLESGSFGMTAVPTAVGPLVEHAIALLGPLAEEYDVRLVDRLPADAAWASCDADRVLQVLVNLLGNALKYAPAGSAVTVSVVVDDRLVRVAVADSGRGIPEAELEAVFGRFHQVAPADDARRGGTGLGLAICKAIVEAHGGTIRVANDSGAVFTFTLPAASPTPPADDRRAVRQDADWSPTAGFRA
jgi:signal transduction histidine kinase